MQHGFINKKIIILYLQKKMKRSYRYIFLGFAIAISITRMNKLEAQPLLSWEKLSDVNFDLVWFEEYQSKFMVPRFGTTPSAYKNKKVKIKGYIIPVDATKNLYVISKVPMAMCFFCGGSGSETIVELEMKKGFSRTQ
jgi:hypothetical protein